jgi:hypothetical protein
MVSLPKDFSPIGRLLKEVFVNRSLPPEVMFFPFHGCNLFLSFSGTPFKALNQVRIRNMDSQIEKRKTPNLTIEHIFNPIHLPIRHPNCKNF